MQVRASAQCQCTGVDVGATGVGVGAVQGQRCGSLLGQAAGAAQVAVEGEVVAAEDGQRVVEGEVVGEGDRCVRIERRSACDRHRTGAQRSIVADHQAAGVERYAAAEGAAAVERLHACTVLDQAAVATDRTAEGAVHGAAQGQRAATQRHRAAGDAGQRADGLVARRNVERAGTGQVHRAGRGEAATRADRQRAVVDGGTTGVGVGTAQGHGGRTVLDQAAGTGNHTAQCQRLAAKQVEVRARCEPDVVGQVDACRCVQRRVAAHCQRTAAERSVVADHQATAVECDATTEQIGASQCEDAGAILDQATGAGNRAIEEAVAHTTECQRLCTQAHRRARHAVQRADGLVGTCGGDIEAGACSAQRHRAGGCKAAARTNRQRTGSDEGAAGVGVGTGQRLDARTDLGQATRACDRATEGAIGGAADFDRVGAEVHRTVADQGSEHLRAAAGRQIQRGTCGEVHGTARRQAGTGPQRQRAGVDVGATGIAVDAIQGQRRAAVLGQAAGTGKDAVERQCVGPEHGQPGVERDVVGQRCQAGGIQRGSTADRQCTGAQRRVIAEYQPACIEGHAAAKGVGTGQRLYARAHLDQPPAATDHAVERGVAGRTERQ